MASLKIQFSRDHDYMYKALDKGSDKEALHKGLKKALDKGLDESLDEVLGKGLTEALGKSLNEALDKGLDKTLSKALYKGLHETLQEALQEALHKDFDEAAHKALDHDPILLEYLHPSAAALLETIIKSIKTQTLPRGKKAICAIQKNGGITEAFDTIAELAEYIYSKYGQYWKQHVQLKDGSIQPAQPDPIQL